MKGFSTWLYAILVLFAVIGSIGYTAMSAQYQFVVALGILGVLITLAFFKVITLPTKDGFNGK